MIRLAMRPRGKIALLVRRDAPELIANLFTGALTQAAVEFCTGRLKPVSVKDRFSTGAFATHRYSQRAASYRAKQQKRLGRIQPFFSPRVSLNFQKVAEALTKPGVGSTVSALRDLARQSQPHLRDLITTPGVGWRVQVKGKRKQVLSITFPAARILNRRPQYARAFGDLRRGGAYRAIRARTADLVQLAIDARAKREKGQAVA